MPKMYAEMFAYPPLKLFRRLAPIRSLPSTGVGIYNCPLCSMSNVYHSFVRLVPGVPMDRELVDRAETIQKRILQLRDSL